MKSQSIIQNIINNNYNINNVTNTNPSQFTNYTNSPDDIDIKQEKIEIQKKMNDVNNNETMNIKVHSFRDLKSSVLINNSEMTRVTTEGMDNGSKLMKNRSAGKMRFMEFSQIRNESFGPLSNIKDENSAEENELIDHESGDLTLNDIDKKMGETDFKGRPIEQESEVISENSLDDIKFITPHKKMNPFFDSKEAKIIVPNVPKKKKIGKFESFSKNIMTRPTYIKVPKINLLKPMKSNISINPIIQKLKPQILYTATNMIESSESESEVFYDDEHENEEKSFNFGPDEDLLVSQNISDLNKKIENQFNPLNNNRKNTMYVEKSGRSDFQSIIRKMPFYSNRVSQIETSIKPKSKIGLISISKNFKDLAFVCTHKTKYLKYLQMYNEGLSLISKNNMSIFLSLKFEEIKKVILSEKDKFLMRIVYKQSSNTKEFEIILEVPTRRKLVIILKKSGLQHCIMTNKTLEIEGDDPFKNSTLNIFPRSQKQGFLELFVDDFFNDWKTFYVTLVDKTLFLFPVSRKMHYSDYKSSLRKVKIYRMISFNLVKKTHTIGLNRRYSFVVKIKNENTQLILSAYNRSERREWLNIF